jgi:hypothetical protein
MDEVHRHRWIVTLVVTLMILGGTTLAVWSRSNEQDAATPGTFPTVTSTTATTTTTPTTTTTVPATTTTTRPPATTTTTTAPPVTGLREGAQGPEVVALQQRLLELGYWLPGADGVFGSSTTHAVVAFQKLHGLARDGVVGDATKAALAAATRPAPRSTSGHLAEVDVGHQVVLLVDGGSLQWVFDASTGKVAGTTPAGQHAVYHQVDGYDRGPLGVLYRPKYFHQGVAIHGYPSVPAYPASHGCVRVTDPAIDWLWASGSLPIGTPVWVY